MAPHHARSVETGLLEPTDVPSGPHRSMPIVAIIVLVIGLIIVISIFFLPSTWMVDLHDFIRRGFKRAPPKPKVNSQLTYNFFNPNKKAEYERKLREEEERNKPFLQRHLETLRAWKKPARQNDPEAAIAMNELPALPTVRAPPAAAPRPQRPGVPRSYAEFKEYEKRMEARKAGMQPNHMMPISEER